MATRIALIGGFLGAGKSAFIEKMSKHMVSSGGSVIHVTIEAGHDPVDVRGADVNRRKTSEVFTYRSLEHLEGLSAFIRGISLTQDPDLIALEVLGTGCGLMSAVKDDLVRTFGADLSLAPPIVIVDAPRMEASLRKGSPIWELRRGQVAEAEVVVLSKVDAVTLDSMNRSVEALKELNPRANTIPFSAMSGRGCGDILPYLTDMVASTNWDICTSSDVRSSGGIGFYNGTFQFLCPGNVDIRQIMAKTASAMSIEYDSERIAHVKMALSSDGFLVRASTVGDMAIVGPVVGIGQYEGNMRLTINARIMTDPVDLRLIARKSALDAIDHFGASVLSFEDECFATDFLIRS